LHTFFILAKINIPMNYLRAIFFFSLSFFAQNKYPQGDFRSPLDIPMQLSGNFGELRPNHFHAGFDFKTQQKEGLNVYAVADGYVSRIKISTSGYGKAIYITHANGYTSVYGHLQKAVGSIQDTIIAHQYAAQSYELEAFFKPNELLVKQGDVIAISGNTGGSEGPHLHFEIRDNSTENIINPLHFGLDLKDTKAPQISNLYVYPLGDSSVVNESKRPLVLNLSLQADGTYLSEKVLANGTIGFGISSFDYDDVSYNVNGTYKTELFSNGNAIFGYQFDSMSFDEGRYVNALIDYGRYKKMHQRVQKLFMNTPYNWGNMISNENLGKINVTPNFYTNEKIEVSDFNGNKCQINIPVEYSSKPAMIQSDLKVTPYKVNSKIDSVFEKDHVSIFFPAHTFYDDFYLNFDVKNNIIYLHEDLVPAHTNFTIAVEDSISSPLEKEKMFIASVNGSKLNYINTKLSGTTFSCKTKTLGQFKLVKDEVAPVVKMTKSIQDKWITNQKNIEIQIADALSGIKTYTGYLNDQWVLFEYESKLNKLTYEIKDVDLLEGKNNLKLIVTDNVGNSTIFETQFYRSIKK
jgi:hypothetical protein